MKPLFDETFFYGFVGAMRSSKFDCRPREPVEHDVLAIFAQSGSGSRMLGRRSVIPNRRTQDPNSPNTWIDNFSQCSAFDKVWVIYHFAKRSNRSHGHALVAKQSHDFISRFVRRPRLTMASSSAIFKTLAARVSNRASLANSGAPRA